MSQTAYTPPTHTLRWPIDDDKSNSLTLITFKLLSISQHKALVKQHEGQDKALERAVICESTGLTLAEVGKLVTADFNTIKHQVFTLTGSNAEDIAKLSKATENASKDMHPLLVSIKGDDGQDITQYRLKPPTVATTDVMESYQDEWEKTLFISTSCTGLGKHQIESLSLPDFNQLQERLIDFLHKSADYFPLET